MSFTSGAVQQCLSGLNAVCISTHNRELSELKGCTVDGNDNAIRSAEGSQFTGDRLTIFNALRCKIKGDECNITSARKCLVIGNDNVVQGEGNTVIGTGNKVTGKENTCKETPDDEGFQEQVSRAKDESPGLPPPLPDARAELVDSNNHSSYETQAASVPGKKARKRAAPPPPQLGLRKTTKRARKTQAVPTKDGDVRTTEPTELGDLPVALDAEDQLSAVAAVAAAATAAAAAAVAPPSLPPPPPPAPVASANIYQVVDGPRYTAAGPVPFGITAADSSETAVARLFTAWNRDPSSLRNFVAVRVDEATDSAASASASNSLAARRAVIAPKTSLLDLHGEGRLAGDGDAKCVICLSNKSDVLMEPCCHVCCCIDCARELAVRSDDGNTQCPTCRVPVHSAKRVFV